MELEEGATFHGHLCPMFALGVRMGNKALEELGRDREDGVKLSCVVEFRNCFSDGIQYVCGTTFGKNNLHYRKEGKFAASFYDHVTGKSARIAIKPAVVKETLREYGRRGQEVKAMPPAERKREAEQLLKKGREMAERLFRMEDAELFYVTDAPPFEAPEEPDLVAVTCEECGELLVAGFAREGRCKTCSEKE